MSRNLPDLCHLNGRILPLSEARVSPRDRGFLFGDALYEGFKVLGGTVLHLEGHLERLRSGLARMRIPEPADLQDRSLDLVAACHLDTGFLYLQVSRGVGPRTRFPDTSLEPTVFLEATARQYEAGAAGRRRVVTMPDPRWLHPDIKSTSLAATVTGKLVADDAGADEILFVGEGGEIREGGTSNFFARRGDVLETHPLDGRVLPGITRQLVITLARDLADGLGVQVEERAPRIGEADGWDEAFLTGTLTGLQPVVEMDGKPIADGAAGPCSRALGAALDNLDARRSKDPASPVSP